MEFVAIDVETANADMASICQIGIARYRQGSLVEEWSSLVDPEDWFDWVNVSIHGITEDDVAGQPKLPELAGTIRRFLNGAVTVCHTHFDRTSIGMAFDKYRLAMPVPAWLDSARVARRTWPEVARRGYGLSALCERLGYEYRAHDALEDAKAAGRVMLAAMEATGLDLAGWQVRVTQPIDPDAVASGRISRDGNPDGPLHGEVVAFTGSLTIPRRDAADLAASIGCAVSPDVTLKTSILVVGDQDVTRLAGHSKSRKHRKAEDLIKGGQRIRIIRETDFARMVRENGGETGEGLE